MPPGPSSAIARLNAGLSATGPAGTTTCALSSNATTPKRSAGSSRSTSATSARCAASSRSPPIEPLRSSTTCTAAAGRALGLRRLGRTQLEQDGQLVGLLDGDQIDVDMGVQMHRVLLVVTGIEDGSSPSGDL